MRYTERERNKREQNFNGARARCVYGKYNFLVSNDNRKRIYQALASKRRNTMQEKMKENSSIEYGYQVSEQFMLNAKMNY